MANLYSDRPIEPEPEPEKVDPTEFKEIDKASLFKAINYTPHAGQWEYHNSSARFKIQASGRRYGKSTSAARDEEPKLFAPKTRGWIIGTTYDLGEKEFRVIWDDLIVGRALGKDKRVKTAYNKRQGDMYIEFPWGARVEVRSADHAPDLVGEALDWVIFSEAAKHNAETWNRYIRPSLADRRGSAAFPSTPEGWNWFYDLFGLGRDPAYPDYASWQNPSWLNTFLYPGGKEDPEIRLMRQTMSKEEFDQEIAALFTSFVGKIFPEWSEEVHVQHVPFDPALPNYAVWDFGWTSPITCTEFQLTPTDQVRVWREYSKSHINIDDAIAECNAREQPPGYHVNLAIGDSADPASCLKVYEHFAPCFYDPEIKVDWRQGINLINRFLKMRQVGEKDEYGTPAEEPGFVVDFSCAKTRKEFNNYKRKKKEVGNDLTGSVVATGEDHHIDPIRYGLVAIFVLGVTRHLNEIYVRTNPISLMGEKSSTPLWTPERSFDNLASSDSGIFTMNLEF